MLPTDTPKYTLEMAGEITREPARFVAHVPCVDMEDVRLGLDASRGGWMLALRDDANDCTHVSGPFDPRIEPEMLVRSRLQALYAPFN